MSEFLDELARTMATAMPRRRALRVLGGALVAVTVPAALRPSPARGGTAAVNAFGPSTTLQRCSKDCSGATPVTCICPGPDPAYCFETCGPPGYFCCCFKDKTGKPSGAGTCPPGTRCGRPGEVNCPCLSPCGINCCRQGEFCGNPDSSTCCKQDERACGPNCCQPNEECKTVRISTASVETCVQRCPQGRAWCGRSKCCPPKWHCVNERTGLCSRCSRNEEKCGEKCCDKRTSRCCGENVCCKKGRACCTVDGQRTCCPPRTKCAPQILPGQSGLTRNSPRVCCPLPRFSTSEEICCPPGQVALNTPGFAIPPPGISPFCCPPGQICPSAVAGKACVNLQSDPRNCGSCGNQCPSGICRGGVCAP